MSFPMLFTTVWTICCVSGASGFVNVQLHRCPHFLVSSPPTVLSSLVTDEATAVEVDPKECVKLFGRLAEKYIMLDPSGGMCCYSGCSDCEYREPGGGYRMADQSSSRPKWIPVYEERLFESNGKQHSTKWSTEIFKDGPAVTKEDFVSKVVNLAYLPPLGGPYVSGSAASIDDISTVEKLFDILVPDGKEKLTRHRMGLKMKEISNGEEGVTWAAFSAALLENR